jgi:phage baseplate assembly protein W
MDVAFPLHFDPHGQTAASGGDAHVREMIEQLLSTSPGERVNRPDFGSGLLQLVFSPNSPELAATLQYTLQAALQRWLGDLIAVTDLAVTSVEAQLEIVVRYTLRSSGQTRVETFTRSGG